MGKLAKFISVQFWASILRWFFTAYGLAWLLAAVTAVVALVQDFQFPIAYLVAACMVVVAMGTVTAFFGSQVLFRNNPEGKFIVTSLGLGVMKDRPDGPLAGIKYGFNYTNTAHFPLQFDVKPVKVSLGGMINPKPGRAVTGGTVPGGVFGTFTEAAIPIPAPIQGGKLEGEYEAEISYGRPGKLEYKMVRKWTVFVTFSDTGEIAGFESTDAV